MSGWPSPKVRARRSGMHMAEKIKVMIVDDSALVRQVVAQDWPPTPASK